MSIILNEYLLIFELKINLVGEILNDYHIGYYKANYVSSMFESNYCRSNLKNSDLVDKISWLIYMIYQKSHDVDNCWRRLCVWFMWYVNIECLYTCKKDNKIYPFFLFTINVYLDFRPYSIPPHPLFTLLLFHHHRHSPPSIAISWLLILSTTHRPHLQPKHVSYINTHIWILSLWKEIEEIKNKKYFKMWTRTKSIHKFNIHKQWERWTIREAKLQIWNHENINLKIWKPKIRKLETRMYMGVSKILISFIIYIPLKLGTTLKIV